MPIIILQDHAEAQAHHVYTALRDLRSPARLIYRWFSLSKAQTSASAARGRLLPKQALLHIDYQLCTYFQQNDAPALRASCSPRGRMSLIFHDIALRSPIWEHCVYLQCVSSAFPRACACTRMSELLWPKRV